MAIVVSEGQIRSTTPPYSWRGSSRTLSVADHWMDYAAIYRTQPHVRTAVDFIARNIAQLGLHVYRRVGETDRVRLRSHPLARLIERPNNWTTRHRLIYSVMADRGIYGASFLLKFRPDGVNPMNMLRIPPCLMQTQGQLMPMAYHVELYPKGLDLRPDQVVHFRGYAPEDNVCSVSPIESLRLILDEDLQSVQHRRDLWSNAGRQPLIIRRPKASGEWSQQVAERFSTLFTAALHDPNSMTTPLLEEDMDIVPLSFTAEQSEYTAARMLTREEVATAYHIPLAMFGIAGAPATYGSVEAYLQSLYTETLGPWLDDLENDLELQLFDDFEDMQGVYCEFNIAQKLAGSFLDRAKVLSTAIGVPWMTADEGRAMENLPAMGGNAGNLAVPLNIDVSGESAPEPAIPIASPNGRRNGTAVPA